MTFLTRTRASVRRVFQDDDDADDDDDARDGDDAIVDRDAGSCDA